MSPREKEESETCKKQKQSSTERAMTWAFIQSNKGQSPSFFRWHHSSTVGHCTSTLTLLDAAGMRLIRPKLEILKSVKSAFRFSRNLRRNRAPSWFGLAGANLSVTRGTLHFSFRHRHRRKRLRKSSIKPVFRAQTSQQKRRLLFVLGVVIFPSKGLVQESFFCN